MKSAGMTYVVLIVVALIVGVSFYTNFAMRIRLTKRDTEAGDRLYWWRAGSSEIEQRHTELFPNSYLPRLSHYAFCSILIIAGLILLIVVLQKPN
jgi:hypothetical protein